MDNKTFELMEKMYAEIISMKSDMDFMRHKLSDIESKIYHIDKQQGNSNVELSVKYLKHKINKIDECLFNIKEAINKEVE